VPDCREARAVDSPAKREEAASKPRATYRKPKLEAWAVVGPSGVKAVRLNQNNADLYLLPEMGERVVRMVPADPDAAVTLSKVELAVVLRALRTGWPEDIADARILLSKRKGRK